MTDIGNSQPAIQAFEAPLDKKDDRVAEFEVRAKSPLRKLQHFLHANPTTVPAIVLCLGIAAFGLIVGPRFLSSFNLSLIVQQVTIIGVIGVAQTLIVITAGIDLSVGAIMVLCSVIMGKLAVTAGLPVPLAGIFSRSDLEPGLVDAAETAIRASVEYAFADPDASRGYVRSLSHELSDEVCAAHIGLYVNEHSVDIGDEGLAAIDRLLGRAAAAA